MGQSDRLRCLVWQWGRFGGGPRYALELSEALRRYCGADTRLSLAEGAELLDHPQLKKLNDYPVATYSNRAEFVARTLGVGQARAAVNAGIEQFRPHVAINTMPAYWDAFLFQRLRRMGVPIVTIIHDASLHPGDRFYFTDAMHRHHAMRSAGIVTLSDFVAARLRERRFLKDQPQWTIPHVSFDMPELDLRAPAPPSYTGAAPLRLLMAGRLKTYKGICVLKDALDRLPAERIVMRVSGASHDDEALKALKARPNVELELGWMTDRAFMAQLDWADAVLLPYIEASQSGVIPLAFKRGRPVITTPVGGLPEQVRHGVNGLVATDVSGAAVADAVRQLIGRPELLRDLSSGAARCAGEEWSWQAIAASFMGLAENLARRQIIPSVHEHISPQ